METTRQKFSIQEFLEKAEVPAVPIYIKGKEYIMLIDTGSDESYMDSSILNDIPKILTGYQEKVIGGTAIKEEKSCIYLVEFACGSNEYKDEFIENDFSRLFTFMEQNTGVKLSGILGTKFLMKHKCILDFENLIFYL